MTAQYGEYLFYKGEKYSIGAMPLEMYFELSGHKPFFVPLSTAIARGYIGSWEIIDDRLYLDRLMVVRSFYTSTVGVMDKYLDIVFPNFPDRVFAHWYSGKIIFAYGKNADFVYEGYLTLFIEKGVIEKTDYTQYPNAKKSLNEVVSEHESTDGKAILPAQNNDGGSK
jgi:hypothetical protein